MARYCSIPMRLRQMQMFTSLHEIKVISVDQTLANPLYDLTAFYQ